MREGFIRALMERALEDERIWLITADLGYSVLERFRDAFPSRFVNAGVSEQSMVGVAAGLALSGKMPFTYSIGNFATLRCLEQIRVDVCYQRANVKVVAVGGGFAYGSLGVTHHATEDLAVLRAMPNMTVVVPADRAEAELAVRAITSFDGPAYLRLGKAGEPAVHSSAPDFRLGRAITVRRGEDATIVASGGIVAACLEAADRLAAAGMNVRLISMHTLKPLDRDALVRAAEETRGIVAVEEHTIIGGLGSAVAETLAEHGLAIPFRRVGIPDTFAAAAGGQAYLRDRYGLGPDGIARAVLELVGAQAGSRRST